MGNFFQTVLWCFAFTAHFQFVEGYLEKYKLAKDERICSPTWCNFFSEFVERQATFIMVTAVLGY